MPRGKRIATLLSLVSLALVGAGSASDATPAGAGDGRRVPKLPGGAGGKADSYVNSAAAEYLFTGSAHMTTPAGLDAMTAEEQEAALKKAADMRLNSVASAIVSHLRSQAKAINAEIPDELPPEIAESIKDEDEATKKHILENWKTQQEVSAATRSSKRHLETIRQDADGSYLFDFEVEGLLSSKLATKLFAESKSFDVTVTQYAEPTSEAVRITAALSPSTDGYPRYNELFQDGIFDVAVHVGGDYNKEEVRLCCPDSAGAMQCQKVARPRGLHQREAGRAHRSLDCRKAGRGSAG